MGWLASGGGRTEAKAALIIHVIYAPPLPPAIVLHIYLKVALEVG